jgi:hypothetical protein
MKRREQIILALALAGALTSASAVLAGGGGSEAKAERGASYVAGPAKATDRLNGIVVDVPAGWYAIVPTRGLSGSTTVANYDMGHAEDWLPAHSSHVLLDKMAKVDLTELDLDSSLTLEQWADRRLHRDEMDGGTVAASRKIVYQVAGRKAVAYVARLGVASKVEIALAWRDGKVLLASVAPLDTVDLDAALAVIDSARPKGSRGAVRHAHLSAPIRALIDGELARAGSLSQVGVQAGTQAGTSGNDDKMGLITAAAGACTGWTGTDNGTCAAGMSCASNASITLYLPFFFQTWWQSGGAGSFFGNNYHGNCNLDYYAIDFNQYSSSSCSASVNDTGQRVYAAAAGTATTGFDAGGYGNYVLVSHSNGYKTRYAHLQSVNVVNNQAVTTQTIVGFVGDTGSAAGAPHLHFGYQTGGVSYCNRAGGCPNGEAARSPQTQKPSPMQTNLGSKNIVDFGCFQGPP